MRRANCGALALAIGMLCAPTQAQNIVVDEARFGVHGAQAWFLEPNHPEREQVAISASAIFSPVNIDLFGIADSSDSELARSIFNPRPHLGAMINLDDNGTSYGFANLNWQFNVTDRVFLEAGFGMAYTDGAKHPSKTRAGLGAKWQFHETISLGFRATENVNVLVSAEHLSHRRIFDDNNRGLSNLSVKLGYNF